MIPAEPTFEHRHRTVQTRGGYIHIVSFYTDKTDVICTVNYLQVTTILLFIFSKYL